MKGNFFKILIAGILLVSLSGCTLVKYDNNTSDVANSEVDFSADEVAITQSFIEKYPNESANPDVKISTLIGNHARGDIMFRSENGDPVSGGYFFAAKVEGVWKIVLDGNGQISCEAFASYDLPAAMIEGCVTP